MTDIDIEFVGVIPAQAEFFVLNTVNADNGSPAGIDKSPIVAWALEAVSMTPYPVTLEGVKKDGVSIMRPDGAVERPCVDLSLNAADWLKERQEEFIAKRGGKK